MNHKISNEFLTVEVSDMGAELQSIRSAEGIEYLWQGDPGYWKGRAPSIFPYVARLTDGKYTYKGKTYEMPIHGFAPTTAFKCDRVSDTRLIMYIESDAETRAMYPFDFRFSETFTLDGSRLIVSFDVDNRSQDRMYFGIGGHPGFNVPFMGIEGAHIDDTVFSDYRLNFMEAKDPTFIVFTEDCFVTDERRPLGLRDSQYYDLHHDMFDNDALIITDTSHKVRLESDKSGHSVEMHFDDFDYFGFWHWPKTDAPYICLEPWASLPARKGIIEDLETQPSLKNIAPGGTYHADFEMIFK